MNSWTKNSFALLLCVIVTVLFVSPQVSAQSSGSSVKKVSGTVYEDGIPVSGASVYCLYTDTDNPNEWKEIKTTSDSTGKFECKDVPVAPGVREIPVVAQKGDEWCDATSKVSGTGTTTVSLNLDDDKAGTSVVEATVEKESKETNLKLGLERAYPKANGGINEVKKESGTLTFNRTAVTFSELPAGYYQIRITGSQNTDSKCSIQKTVLSGSDKKEVDLNGSIVVTYY